VVKDGRCTRIDEKDLYKQIPRAVDRFSQRLRMDDIVQLRWPVT
jgi:hypothetical protein